MDPSPRNAPDMQPMPGLVARRSLLATAALMPVLGLQACSNGDPLILAGHPWPGYEPMFLARSMGFMPNRLTLVESPNLKASIDAIKQGKVHGVMLTLDEILVLRDQGIPLEVVLVFNVSKGADVFLVKQTIGSLQSIKGKRIGLEDSALGTLMLTMVLERAGLQMEEVTPTRIVYEEHEAAWTHGDMDALVTYEPVAGRLKSQGARQLLSTRELPDTIFDVLAVRPDVAKMHAETLRATLAGHFKALAYMRQNAWDAAYRVAPRLNISAEEMVASLRGLELPDLVGNRRYLSGQGGQILSVAQKLSTILLQAKLVKAPLDTEQLFNGSYLPGDSA